MNIRTLSGLAALLCMAIPSCYPLEDPQIKQGPGNQTQQPELTPEQLKAKAEEEARLKAAEEALRQQQANDPAFNNPNITNPTNPTNNSTRPPVNTNGDYPFASKVPGKEGFVFSPYNNKVVDVRDIPTGTLVLDPTILNEKKYFRVP